MIEFTQACRKCFCNFKIEQIFKPKNTINKYQRWMSRDKFLEVSVSDKCVSNPGRDIAAKWGKFTGVVNMS